MVAWRRGRKRILSRTALEGKSHKQHLDICALADCIRDGIERAYPNWDEWQYIAREMLKQLAPMVYKDLDSYETVVKGER